MDAVKTALVNACTSDGWTQQTDAEGKTVLSKSGIYVRVEALDDAAGDSYNALIVLGRTGLDSGDAPNIVQMRDWNELITLPVVYHIFTFTAEVFMVISWSDKYQWVAFGQSPQSGLTGTGNWVAASFGGASFYSKAGFKMTASGDVYRLTSVAPALFWANQYFDYNSVNNGWVHNNMETSYPWALGNGSNLADPIGIKYLTEIIKTQPNAFNSESVLMPIRAYKVRPENKVSQILEIENARHIRVDNYNNEQIITLGTDEWMVFPYYKKDINNRNGGTKIDHTGTFGWAIKYEV